MEADTVEKVVGTTWVQYRPALVVRDPYLGRSTLHSFNNRVVSRLMMASRCFSQR